MLTTSLRADEAIAEDVAVVVSTSGTTGVPKGAMLSAAALTASASATHDRLGGAGRGCSSCPPTTSPVCRCWCAARWLGPRPWRCPRLRRHRIALRHQRLGTGRRYASMVAVQLDKALRDPAATAALAELDAVLIGGGPMPAAIGEKAAAAGISVIRTYGMSETAGGCVYDGRPLDGVRIRIEDGRVVLGGPTLATGYRNPLAPDPFAERGWFRTDDVGAVDASGTLRVMGRADDAISTGGLTVFPQLVEAALSTHPAVADCAVFGVPDERLGQRVAAAVVVADATAPTVADLRPHVAQTLAATAAPREVHVVDALPRRGIGKVNRRELSARFGGS